MPFSISFLPPVHEAPRAGIEERLVAAAEAGGARSAGDGRMQAADGVEFQLDRNTLWVSRLSRGVCKAVFEIAARTSSLVVTGGAGEPPLRVHGRLVAPPELGPAVTVASGEALCARLRPRLRAWNRFVRKAQSEGLMGSDEQLLQPPADPGSEPRLAEDPSGVAAQCEGTAAKMEQGTGWRRVATIVSRHPKWGVVWRADYATVGDHASQWRHVCWRNPKVGGVALMIRPLEMFDPTDSVPPLSVE